MDTDHQPTDSRAFTRAANDYIARVQPEHDQVSMQLGLVLVRAANQFVQESERRAQRPFGLSWRGLSVTFALGIFGSLEASTIARLTGVSRQAISLVTATLERDGLVRRTAGHDRRRRPLELTDAGQAAMVGALGRQGELSDEWFAELTEEERATLYRLLVKVVEGGGRPVS